jgi:large subunit ribosomal protein L28
MKMMIGVRGFSTSIISNARVYKSVINRQLKQQPDFKIGDLRPKKLWIPKDVSKYPAYPYGEARIFKRSDRGLFGGQVIAFGNKVSEMGNRSRRSWLPNVINKGLWSQSLNRIIKMRLTARVLRTITKEGGLDNYLTKDKEARIKELGLYGWRLRYDVLKAREQAVRAPAFEIITKEDGSQVKVYYKGTYQGKEIQLKIGKRKLFRKLFPAVKLNTVNDLKYNAFSITHAGKTIPELLAECESLNVDLSDSVL